MANSSGHHEYDDDPDDGLPVRAHAIEYDDIVASTDRHRRGGQPLVFVCVSQREKLFPDHHVELGEPVVAIAADHFPHLTPAEARQLVATLLDATARADEIAGQR